MLLPDLTVLDQRQVAPNRVRSLLRLVEHGERRWYVAEIDCIVDCGRNWNRAAELLAAAELPARREGPMTWGRIERLQLDLGEARAHDPRRGDRAVST